MNQVAHTGAGILQTNRLLQGLSPGQVQAIHDRGEAVEAAAGEVVISEGSAPQHIFLVLEGELEVFLPHNDNRFSEVGLSKLAPGDYAGEYSLLDKLPASASVRAVGPTVLYRVPQGEVKALFDADPGAGMVIYRNLLSTLVKRQRETDRELDLFGSFD